MKHYIKSYIAQLLQWLLKQTWIRKMGQRVSVYAPWLKRSLLRLLYNTPHRASPNKILHQGIQEARIDAALKQRIKEYQK